MADRIITLQRTVRELGRLRAGLMQATKSGRQAPTASRNWILTSPNREYLDVAATLWGGRVEPWQPQGAGAAQFRVVTSAPTIDAILPPGDPLSQSYEIWTRGGCQRRCNGEREILGNKGAGQPCACRTEYGDDFHKIPAIDPNTKQPLRCQMMTRLSVFLPELPDIGIWRVESKGFWAATHITSYVDLIKGQVGPSAMVPVRLGIEPRTRVRDGKTSQFVEIVVSLRSAASFGQILASPEVISIGAAQVGAAIGSGERVAIAAAAAEVEHEPEQVDDLAPTTADIWQSKMDAAPDERALRGVWGQMKEAGVDDADLRAYWWGRKKQLGGDVPEGARIVMPSPPPSVASTLPSLGGRPIEDVNALAAEDEMAEDEIPAEDVPEVVQPPAAPDVAMPEPGEPEPDVDATWNAILAHAGKLGWNTAAVMEKFAKRQLREVADANGWDMASFLDAMKNGQVK